MQLDEGAEDIEDTSKKEKKEKKRKSTKKSKREKKVVETYSENEESSNSNSISNYDLAFPMMEYSNGNVYYSVPNLKQSPSLTDAAHNVPNPSTSGANVIPPTTPPKPIELEKTVDTGTYYVTFILISPRSRKQNTQIAIRTKHHSSRSYCL